MPGPTRQLTLGEAREHVHQRCFTDGGHDLVGLETEWLVVVDGDPAVHAPFARLQSAMGAVEPLPHVSRVTYEPGGQLELSGPPFPTVGEACRAMTADLTTAERSLRAVGITLVGEGIDAGRKPERVMDTPRYAAMERYFDADGPEGRRMMSSTAALQVNVGLGAGEGEVQRRWLLAHALGPML